MRPGLLALLLSLAVGVGCLVNTRSGALACATQADCDAPRVCEGGYCVIDQNACPSDCTGGCDVTASPPTCVVNGAGGDSVTCPAGYHCDIICTTGACGNVDCTDAASCTIQCAGTSACQDVTCGTADCEITCAGTDACTDVTCGSQTGNKQGRCHVSCSGTSGCGDVTCTSACDCVIDGCTGSSDCGALACPRAAGNTYCTESGSNGVPCIDTKSGCSC